MTSVAAEAEATMVVKVVAAVGDDAGCLRFAGLLKNAAASSRGKLRGYSHPARGDERGESGGAGGGGGEREPGMGKPAAMAAEVSRLGLALHFARRTYSNRFARIRATKSQSEEDPGIYIGNACAGGEGGNGGITPSRGKPKSWPRAGMRSSRCSVSPIPRGMSLKNVGIIPFHRSASFSIKRPRLNASLMPGFTRTEGF